MSRGPFGALLDFFRNLLSRPRSTVRNPLLERCSSIANGSIPRINALLGLDYRGQALFKIDDGSMNVPAATSGSTVTVSPKWFQDHPNDDGAIVHELVHVVMHCPRMDGSNWWMIEGMADYCRDKLGYTTSWSTPTRGDPKSGYQGTAHFLLFVEQRFGQEYIKKTASGLSMTGDLPQDIEEKLSLYMGIV